MSVTRAAYVFFAAAFMVVAALTFPAFPGSPMFLLAFHIGFLGLCLLALRAPRSYTFVWLAACLWLGFWAKLAAHQIFRYPMVEPVGAFRGEARSLDAMLWTATVAALGASAVRVLQLVLFRGRESTVRGEDGPPAWYGRARPALWIGSGLVSIGISAWNLQASFYQVGVDVRTTLPFHLSVLPSWWLTMGAPLWLALLLTWELRWAQYRHATLRLAAPLAEALVATVSMLSRGAPLPRLSGYGLVVVERRLRRDPLMGRGPLWPWIGLAASAAVTFLMILVLVSGMRVARYPYPTPSPSSLQSSLPSPSNQHPSVAPGPSVEPSVRARNMAREVLGLFVDRWIGLEGVLAVVSYPDQGPGLLRAALVEDPRLGTRSLYQRIAQSPYTQLEHLTFLTLAGPVAVLRYSGSDLVVAVGMVLLTGLLLLTEAAAQTSIGSEFVTATAAVAAVYVTIQTNFPYLTAVFFLELWATLALLASLSWLGRRGGAR